MGGQCGAPSSMANGPGMMVAQHAEGMHWRGWQNALCSFIHSLLLINFMKHSSGKFAVESFSPRVSMWPALFQPPILSPLPPIPVLDSKAIDLMNALMRLNQIRPGLQYKLLSQSGPVHAPVFTMSVDVDGTTYEASGPSKKTAKLHVAVKVKMCGRAKKVVYLNIQTQFAG